MNKTYFLGAPSPEGFDTSFGEEIASPGLFTYIIKGGPGTGKSTFMKRLAKDLSDVDEAELYYCSSDPDSLDAVIFRNAGVIVVDGTSPHVFEPKYPGAKQQLLDFSAFWDEDMLKNRADEIVEIFEQNAALHQRAKKYLAALKDLGEDTCSIGEHALEREKLLNFSERLAKKLFPKTGRKPGKIALKQITSITPKGVVTLEQAFSGCRVFFCDDRLFAATDCLLKSLSVKASAAGYDVIVSKNVLLPGCRYEHMVLPELGLAFLACDSGEQSKRINGMRFYGIDAVRKMKKRLKFNASLRKELTDAAVNSLNEAKSVHDKLEEIYISGMDFSRTDELLNKIEGVIRERSENQR